MSCFAAMEIKSRRDSCETHGEFDSRNFFGAIWSSCPVCENIRREAGKAEAEAKQMANIEAGTHDASWVDAALRRLGCEGLE